MKNEHPILFSGEMVRPILDGRKTQTRRIIKPQPIINKHDRVVYWNENTRKVINEDLGEPIGEWRSIAKLFGKYKVGDRLWVRETWLLYNHMGTFMGNIPKQPPEDLSVGYKADGLDKEDLFSWRSPIHIPKWAARIWLEITGIRVERVQEITVLDAQAEGVIKKETTACNLTIDMFQRFWDSLNAKRGFGWDKNPWVWCISFKRTQEIPNGKD